MSRQTAMPPPPLPVLSSSPNRSGMPSPGMLAPNKYSQRGSMPPPKLPASSCRSSTSSRPSFALSDGSDNNSVYGNPNSSNERIKTPLQDSKQDNISTMDDVEAQFANLMDTLEVPSSVRIKFGTVGRDVKQSILMSSQTSNPAILGALGLPAPIQGKTAPQKPKMKKNSSAPFLRKSKSSASLDGEQPAQVGGTYNYGGDQFTIVASPSARPGGHSRGQSVDVGRASTPLGRQRGSVPPSPRKVPPSPARSDRSFRGSTGPAELPENYVQWLRSSKATDLNMDVGKAKKLRMLLRHEATGWVATFIDGGGYDRLLDRVQDLLDVEWREEQHDDKMLYELLRCVKALSTSEVGKAALRARHPRPFPALSQLLFSEKKPGELACRQIIVEMWLFHFELFPPQSETQRSGSLRFETPNQVGVVDFVRSLLLPDKEDKAKDYHDFITQAHRPRIFKAWVQEMADLCRDYFWIMCHGSNTLWRLSEVDVNAVERPVAPGGATGGVEFEAMGYATIHFRLLNTLVQATAEQSMDKARQLHHDLLMSGLDRILVTFRKASTTYYPTLHLELARYVDFLRRVSPDHKLPYLIGKMVGSPPEELKRHRSAQEWLPRSWESQSASR